VPPASDRADFVPACSVARTLETFSDIWTFLIIREAFSGVRRFQDFQQSLSIPKGTLAKRLSRLVEKKIFKKVRYSTNPLRFEYRFTRRGRDLYPVLIALQIWGDRWLLDGKPAKSSLFASTSTHRGKPMVVCSHCRQPLKARDVRYEAGPGEGWDRIDKARRNRRHSESQAGGASDTCSVVKTLRLVGDRWSFLVQREAYFGIRRFDEMCARLNIATNILSDRLQRLTAAGIFERRVYQTNPTRHEYRLTEKGHDLYPSMSVMFRWGDTWLDKGRGPPLITRHEPCGHRFHPLVICSACGEDIVAPETA